MAPFDLRSVRAASPAVWWVKSLRDGTLRKFFDHYDMDIEKHSAECALVAHYTFGFAVGSRMVNGAKRFGVIAVVRGEQCLIDFAFPGRKVSVTRVSENRRPVVLDDFSTWTLMRAHMLARHSPATARACTKLAAARAIRYNEGA